MEPRSTIFASHTSPVPFRVMSHVVLSLHPSPLPPPSPQYGVSPTSNFSSRLPPTCRFFRSFSSCRLASSLNFISVPVISFLSSLSCSDIWTACSPSKASSGIRPCLSRRCDRVDEFERMKMSFDTHCSVIPPFKM